MAATRFSTLKELFVTAGKVQPVKLEALVSLETEKFWATVSQHCAHLSVQIGEILNNNLPLEKSRVSSSETLVIHAFLRLNSFRMAMEAPLHHVDMGNLIYDILPSPKIESICQIALVVRKTHNTNTAAIIIGGLFGSCRKLAQHLSMYATQWSADMQQRNTELMRTLNESCRTSHEITTIQPTMDHIERRLNEFRALVGACPFLTEFLCPEEVLSAISCIVETTADKVVAARKLFLSDSMQGLKLAAALSSARRVAMKVAFTMCCFLFPGLRPEIVRETDSMFTQRIEETCNNLCAAAMRHTGKTFRQWIQCVCGETTGYSEDTETLQDYSTARGACMALIDRTVSTAREVEPNDQGAFRAFLAEMIAIESPSSFPNEGKAIVSNPADVIESPAISQLLEIFPHWKVSVIPRILSRYGNNVEKIIDEALCCNLPPDLQTALEGDESNAVLDTQATQNHESGEGFSLFSNRIPYETSQPAERDESVSLYDPFKESLDLRLVQTLQLSKMSQKAEWVYDDEPAEEMEFLDGRTGPSQGSTRDEMQERMKRTD